ncbi:MAG TPA: sialate O-acetylesterase [Armatimonadota bacterium]
MAVKLPALFCEHMVLQRDIPLPVWGWAESGEAIRVEIAGVQATGVAGADGRWRVTLPALPAGGPHTLTVCGANTVTVADVLVGDVWVCSGQSNMEWPLNSVNDATEEVAAAQYPAMRLFTVPKTAVIEARVDTDAYWSLCEPRSAEAFSAVAYFFGRELHSALDVPIGLINTSWGGTLAEAWTSREALLSEPELRDMVTDYEKVLANPDAAARESAAAVQAWWDTYTHDPGNFGLAKGWAAPETDTRNWPTMKLPTKWQGAGHPYSGVFWFRKEVNVPADWAGRELELGIGACDKDDQTYFNGVQVGSLTHLDRADSWCTLRSYPVPGALVRPGKNVITVRAFSYAYDGGLIGPAGSMRLTAPGSDPIFLDGDWQYQVEHNLGQVPGMPAPPLGDGNPNSPFALFNGMIAPLLPYAIKGAIWYQGESNADRAEQYRTLFPTMISDWRRAWGQGDFPFYFVQLANYMSDPVEPVDTAWARLREAQTMTLSLPHTGMAVIIDIGEPNDIHPRNKQDVGRRLALNALGTAYGHTLTYSGPLYRAATVEGNAIRVTFDHVGGGLLAKGGALRGFAIAGADKQFIWAEATIDGDSVVVSSPVVPAPVAVRYGWANDPQCTLYNDADLPASPFRSDDWPLLVPAGVC